MATSPRSTFSVTGPGLFLSKGNKTPCYTRELTVQAILEMVSLLYIVKTDAMCVLSEACGALIDQKLALMLAEDEPLCTAHAHEMYSAVLRCVAGVPEWVFVFFDWIAKVHLQMAERGFARKLPLFLLNNVHYRDFNGPVRFRLAIPYCFHVLFGVRPAAVDFFLQQWRNSSIFRKLLVFRGPKNPASLLMDMCQYQRGGEVFLEPRTTKFIRDLVALSGEFDQRAKVEAQLRELWGDKALPKTVALAVTRAHAACNRVCSGCSQTFFVVKRCWCGCKDVVYCSHACAKSHRKSHDLALEVD